ncbi:MAG: type VI secretion system tip protein VgrG, partial [Motiliproteus sp.]
MVFQRASDARFHIEISDAEVDFQLLSLQGKEALSQLFSFQLAVVCDDAEVALESLLGQSAVVTLLDPDCDSDRDEEAAPRFIHGIIGSAALVEQGTRLSRYQLTLVPKLALLEYRHNSRIFQQRSLAQILSQLLDEAGLSADEFRFELQRDYPVYDYCVQYRESELNFCQRLLEAEGIHYYFEHQD